MKITNVALVDLDGRPLKENVNPMAPLDPNAPILTVARVIEASCMSGARQGQPPRTADENVERMMVAIECHKAKIGDAIELDAKVVARVKDDVQLLSPIVAAQMALILEGKELPIAVAA
jgi:hypothetical protein